MSLEYIPFPELPPNEQEAIAQEIADYTQGKTGEIPQMLPVTPEEIFGKYAGWVALQNSEFAGYVGATDPEEWQEQQMSEVGTLWVPKAHQKQGIGHGLLGNITQDLTDQLIVPYGFGNKFSLQLFIDSLYTVADATAVPASALTLCVKCPAKPSAGCCDTIVVFRGKNA